MSVCETFILSLRHKKSSHYESYSILSSQYQRSEPGN